mgnify:CR=1 FL=1
MCVKNKNSKKSIEFILRYCDRPWFAAHRIIDIRNDYITFWYQRHKDDKIVVEKIHIVEFIFRDVVEYLDDFDSDGVDISVPPRFDCKFCNGKMKPIYYVGVNGHIYDHNDL